MEYLCILCFICIKTPIQSLFIRIEINIANIFENNNTNYYLILIILNYECQ